ncbi:GNAT family N-acetyltransferase [Aureivirga sp. CE67]|uniref:GNAT family N-acetyltransferase n=1 Tax=Aureivirga sp. CE67 TaxID=1788983 RepID=UPI0018C929A5|nr:GNAT family N-acetyltransferase [Aureivirga sp. CE67]
MIKIKEIEPEDYDTFFNYLDNHLSENGSEANEIFQPLTTEQSILTEEWKYKFKTGFEKDFGEIGWRKLWIAENLDNQIVGHIDIRSRMELNTTHRVLLGMGVDSQFRKLKIGQQILEFVIDYCKLDSKICWLDLEVMSQNIPAIRLYEKYNFQQIGKTVDMFRLNNKSYNFTSMTLNVEK